MEGQGQPDGRRGTLAHSVLIVPWMEKDKAGHRGLAFPKAAVADYAAGMEAGDARQTFAIVADKPGRVRPHLRRPRPRRPWACGTMAKV